MEKYYDLIVSMVKEHRKFPGCEDILEDIVKDVCEHAKVVVGAIENEDVLKSYLEKIVTTSMITVPKKLGIFSKRTQRVVIPEIKPFEMPEVKKKDVPEEQLTVQDLEESEDLIADNDAVSLEEEIPEEDNISFETEEEEQIQEIEDTSADETAGIEEEDIYEELESDSENNSEDIIQVDKNLVDKMINGVEKPTEASADEQVLEDDVEASELITDGEDELTVDEEEAVDIVAEDTTEPEEDLAVEDNVVLDEPVLSEDNNEILEGGEVEDLGETIDGLFDNIEEFEDNSELAEFEDVQAEDSDELIQDNAEEDLLAENTVDEVKSGETIYEIFDFGPEPHEADVDCAQILNDLTSLDAKYPDKKIKEICKLKYNDNMSVSDIANKLNISEEDVLESLSEIVYLVKD